MNKALRKDLRRSIEALANRGDAAIALMADSAAEQFGLTNEQARRAINKLIDVKFFIATYDCGDKFVEFDCDEDVLVASKNKRVYFVSTAKIYKKGEQK